jgi:N-acetylneuraminic acid mutarotase
VTLHLTRTFSLPEARQGTASALFGDSAYVTGGLSSADVSTTTVFRFDAGGAPTTVATLPGAVHDAAAADVAGRLILFGGGVSEGSDRILQLQPGTPHLIGTLPQPLSDLTAATIGGVAFVAGGWNGSTTNRSIYAASPTGKIKTVGSLPTGVRYPAVAALGGRLIVAGGETQASTPTTAAWSFDPATARLSRLPDLPVATDHAAGVAIGGRFYVIGGLRDGVFTDHIISWAPGESRWRPAGRLPAARADLAAVPFGSGVAVIAGRGSAGPTSAVTVMTAR